jgi:hypothetical protein
VNTMEWRIIPDYPAYEVNAQGRARKRDTRYMMPVRGRKVSLWTGQRYVRLFPSELVAMAFVSPAPDAAAEELARLRARITELETELAHVTAGPAASRPKPQKPKPATLATPPVVAKPQAGTAKKRYCVVCGRALPNGFWLRCPEHAFRDTVHTEDDFGGAITL